MKHNNLSIKKISELAGVSVATVSRVINKKGRYSAQTEQKVLDIIEKYNYKPNLIAKGLRTNNSLCIGIIVPDITNEFFAKIVRELEVAFFQSGYTVFVCNTDEKVSVEEKYYSELAAKGVVGIIYISGKTNKSSESKIPTVYIDRKPSNENNTIAITSDNIQGGYLATKELIDNGCKDIILLRDQRQISPQKDRCIGYKKALLEADIEVKDQNIIKTIVGYEYAKESIIKSIREEIKFDGVFATTDWMALGVIDGIRECGFKVPDDIKVVGFDNISISEFSAIPITTINQNVKLMAQKAVTFILDMIQNETIDKKRLTIPVNLIRRNSV